MDQSKTVNQLVLVAYYSQSIEAVSRLVEDFEKRSRISIDAVIVVDNGGGIAQADHSGRFKIVAGDNEFWEFSGWIAGLDHADPSAPGILVLLNDSYKKNWSIKSPGRGVISKMARCAAGGHIAGWLDNFSRFSRRPNSRLIVSDNSLRDALRESIRGSVRQYQSRLRGGEPLFDKRAERILERWMRSQHGRWTGTSAKTRWARIFIEHHVFDGVAPGNLIFYPSTWLGSQIYGVTRKLVGERR